MRLQNNLLTFILLCFALNLWQCQAETVEEDKADIFVDLEVRYLAEDLQLRGQASFYQGDSLASAVPLSFAGGVAFMGSGTKLKPLPGGGIRYENTLETAYVSPTRFGFSKPGSKNAITELTLSMEGVESFSVTTASLQAGMRLELSSGLETDESLLLLFTDPEQEARTIVRPGPLSSGELIIPSDALIHFTPGDYRLYMVKSKEISGQEEGVEYHAIIEYYSKEETFKLTN